MRWFRKEWPPRPLLEEGNAESGNQGVKVFMDIDETYSLYWLAYLFWLARKKRGVNIGVRRHSCMLSPGSGKVKI